MKGDTALAHWSNAVEGLESAEILHNHGKYKRAISEAYYTMEAAARASLATKEVHPKTRTRRMESADQQDGLPLSRRRCRFRRRIWMLWEPLAKTGDRPGFICRKPQARDGQWAGRSV